MSVMHIYTDRGLCIDRASFVENRRETLLIALGMTLAALLEAPGGTMGIGNMATSGRGGDWGAKMVVVVGRRGAQSEHAAGWAKRSWYAQPQVSGAISFAAAKRLFFR